MSELETCERCGSPLELLASGGAVFCARCLARSLAHDPGDDMECDAPAMALPRMFGAYSLIEEIGRGGMGVVYRARQLALDRVVALKLLLAGAFSSEATLWRFRREAAAAAGLQHPNIVPIHDYGECDGQPFYTMDLIAGRDLAAVCSGRPLEARRAARLVATLARAVQHAHEAGIVHRDLKPSNVLIDADDRPHITDFGLAKRLDRGEGVTVTGQMVGSPSYAAPEQALAHDGAINVSSDVYGLGALLYHLLTGRPPFNAATPAETLRLVLDTEPPPPRLLNPGLPRDLETISLTCLAKEPPRRYATAGALAEDCERFLEQRPIRARRPGMWYRMRKFARRHRVGVLAAAVVLFALIAGLVIALVGLRRAVDARNAADLARAQAEELMTRLRDDVEPRIADGGLKLQRAAAEAAIRYYETLPPKLRDVRTEQRHAAALESLIEIRRDAGDRAGLEATWRAAVALRRKIVAEIPNDADAAADLMYDEYSHSNSLMAVTNDTRALTDERVRKEILDQWRQLLARFPENPRVKLTLAYELDRFAWLAMEPWCGMHRPGDALAAAEESLTLFDELSVTHPNDLGVRVRRWSAEQLRARVHVAAGEIEKAVALHEKAAADLGAILQENPGNLRIRRRLALTWSRQAFAMSGTSLTRAAAISRQACEQFRFLMRLDPDNRAYAFEYTRAYMLECHHLAWGDCVIEPARQAFRAWDAACEPFREIYLVIPRERWWRSLYLAILAARAGDLADARAQLAEAEVRFEFYRDRLPNQLQDRRRARIDFLSQLAGPLLTLQDWSGLERMAREHLEEVETTLREQPTDADLLLNRPMALGFLGQALARSGKIDEAALVLERAVAGFSDTPLTPSLSWADSIHLDAIECLAEMKLQRGDVGGARDLLERTLKLREERLVVEQNSWLQRELLAATLLKLGGTYAATATDTAEQARRAELLDRAAAILNSPDAEGRITMNGKAAKADVDALRAPRLNASGRASPMNR